MDFSKKIRLELRNAILAVAQARNDISSYEQKIMQLQSEKGIKMQALAHAVGERGVANRLLFGRELSPEELHKAWVDNLDFLREDEKPSDASPTCDSALKS